MVIQAEQFDGQDSNNPLSLWILPYALILICVWLFTCLTRYAFSFEFFRIGSSWKYLARLKRKIHFAEIISIFNIHSFPFSSIYQSIYSHKTALLSRTELYWFLIQSATFIEKEESEQQLNTVCGYGNFAGNQEIELLSSVRFETRVCPFRMTDPAITRAGAAAFPRTIDVAVERINIGAAGNGSVAIFVWSGDCTVHPDVYIFIMNMRNRFIGLTETVKSITIGITKLYRTPQSYFNL